MAFDLQSSLQRAQASLEAPSKRQNRNRSGRASRRTYNGQRTLQAVGGRTTWWAAALADEGAPLCKVVQEMVGRTEGGQLKRPNIRSGYVSGGRAPLAREAL